MTESCRPWPLRWAASTVRRVALACGEEGGIGSLGREFSRRDQKVAFFAEQKELPNVTSIVRPFRLLFRRLQAGSHPASSIEVAVRVAEDMK